MMSGKPFKVTVTRTGGFAGLQRPPLVVDAASLPPAQAARLRELATRAKLAPLGAKSIPDSLHYSVSIDEGGTHPSLELSDPVPKAWRSFLDYVIELAGGTAE